MTSFKAIQQIVESKHECISEQLNSDFYLTSLYFSQLSYFDDKIVIKHLRRLSASHISLYTSENGCKCFLVDFPDLVVVSFRGTIREPYVALRKNMSTSFKFWVRKHNNLYIHHGYLTELEYIHQQIIHELNSIPKGKRVLYVGHSLGGALATILAVMHKPTDLCVFGSPKVAFNHKLSQCFDGVNFHRVSTKWDIVSWLPPSLPLVLPYKHYGHFKILESEFTIRNILKPHRLLNYLATLLKR